MFHSVFIQAIVQNYISNEYIKYINTKERDGKGLFTTGMMGTTTNSLILNIQLINLFVFMQVVPTQGVVMFQRQVECWLTGTG